MKLPQNISDLVYGNVNAEDVELSNETNIYTDLFDHFSKLPVPNFNSSIKEINQLKEFKELMKKDTQMSWAEYKKFMRDCDEDLDAVFEKYLQNLGIPYEQGNAYAKFVDKEREDVGALIMKLKRHYNRPRPFQVAHYAQLDFHPFQTITGNSPAFPSGHACQAHFATMIIAHQYPEKKKELYQLGQSIADTRLVLGVHYPSDNKAGKLIATKLFENPKIKKHLFDS
jgi:hypothetical protein